MLNANNTNHSSYLQHLQQENTELCSPLKQTPTANLHTPTNGLTANNKFLTNANLGFLPTSNINTNSAGATATTSAAPRSTNPFLNAKYDSQSNSDSLSDRISFSGSSAVLDRLQNATDFITGNGTSAAQAVLSNAFMLPVSSTANSLNPHRSHRTKSNRNNGSNNRGGSTSGMTSSSSATSSNSNATLSNANSRNEREKYKLQQLQMELREYSETNLESSNPSVLNGGDGGIDNIVNGEIDGLQLSGGEETEPPPEPAPPEIPPRTQSLLMSLRKHSEYKLKYEEKGDQKHEEFIPTSQLQQLQQQQQKGEFKK